MLCAIMLMSVIVPTAFADDVIMDVGTLIHTEDENESGAEDNTQEEPADNPTEEPTEEPEKVVKEFPDVKPEDWFYSDVTELASMGVVNGYETGLFNPEGNVTRAEFIKLVVATLIKEDQMAYSTSKIFEDVPVEEWYYKYIITAVFYGFINPSDYGTLFKPDEAITRKEVAKIIVSALKVESADYKTPFADADDKNITALYGICLMQGELNPVTGERYFKPDTNISRAEVSAVILRLYKLFTDADAFYADFYEKNPTYQKLELLYAPETVSESYTELTNAWGNTQAFLTYDYEYAYKGNEINEITDNIYRAFI